MAASTKRYSKSGLVGIMLTLVLVFALVAVVELTRTLVAAQQIDTRVADITGSVGGANNNLNTGCDGAKACSSALPVLSQTEAIVVKIDAAAKPLTGQLGQILGSVNGINATASQILSNASSINGTAHSINSLAGSINSSVSSINGNINGISGNVLAIQSGVAGINNRADTVIGLVGAIKSDTGSINSLAGGIQSQAHGIACDKVAGLAGPLSTTC